jgi:protein-disulfide isomerase
MTTPFVATGRLSTPVTDEDHIRGRHDAPVTLVEYGDYQCPYCGAAHPVLQQVLNERPDRVRMVYRHFPLSNVHPHAEFAAQLAEAAGRRHRFWPMHDWLFEHQERIAPAIAPLACAEVGVDADAVEREVREQVHMDVIRRDFLGGVRSGVNGTPTFYLNGVRHDGGYTLADLLAAVDRTLVTA